MLLFMPIWCWLLSRAKNFVVRTPRGDLNQLWIEFRWGEFPIISLTPPAPEEPVYDEADEAHED